MTRSTFRMYLTLIGCAAVLGPAVASAKPPNNLEQSKPLVCRGNNDMRVKGRRIETDGVAITVRGNCDLVLIDSHIAGAKVGILARGNGDVIIRNSIVEGGKAVVVRGNGDVSARRSTFKGPIVRRGSGDFHDKGGNTFAKGGPARKVKASGKDKEDKDSREAPSGGRRTKGSPVKCIGTANLTVRNRIIETKGVAVALLGTCSIRIINSEIRAGKQAVKVVGTGNVTITGSTVHGRRGAVLLVGTGNVIAKDSTLRGGIKRVGTGRFIDKGGNTIKRR